MRATKVGGDVEEATPWIQHFQSECLKELSELAKESGILIESFDVMERMLEGSLGKDLEKQAEEVLRNQMEATQIGLKNKIATEKVTNPDCLLNFIF